MKMNNVWNVKLYNIFFRQVKKPPPNSIRTDVKYVWEKSTRLGSRSNSNSRSKLLMEVIVIDIRNFWALKKKGDKAMSTKYFREKKMLRLFCSVFVICYEADFIFRLVDVCANVMLSIISKHMKRLSKIE